MNGISEPSFSVGDDQGYGVDEVIRRSNLFVEAGADMILLPLTPLEQMATIVVEINAPVMT